MKSDPAIQRETSLAWLRRARTSVREYARTGDPEALAEARSRADEALEHAALTRDGGKMVAKVERVLKQIGLGRPRRRRSVRRSYR